MITDEHVLRFSPSLSRKAVLCFWWRTIGLRYLFALAAYATCVTLLVWQGDRSWLVGAFGAGLIFSVVMPAAIVWTHMRKSSAKLRQLTNPEARLAVAEDYFTVTTDLGKADIRWSSVTALWRFRDFWLVILEAPQFITVPLEFLPTEVRNTLVANIEKAGGRIRG
jgi:hypothetical protein